MLYLHRLVFELNAKRLPETVAFLFSGFFSFCTFVSMVIITKGQSNTLIVTVTEKVTITNPFFLIHFKDMITSHETSFIITNTSTHTERYDEFTFTEGSNTAKTLNVGEYVYTIYAQTSNSNTDIDNADEEVERGIAMVRHTENTFTSNTITTTYKQNVIS